MSYKVSQADIHRYTREFKESNSRARRRFAIGAIVVGVAMLAMLILALYQFQSWAV